MANPRIDELRKRLEREPGSRLFAQLAEELRKEGELTEAIRVARAGLLAHPAYPSARMTLGRALFDTKDLAAARGEFESVLRGAPDNILASRMLGECLEGLGDLGAALLQFRAAMRLVPGDRQLEAQIRLLEQRLGSGTPAPAPRSPGVPPSLPPAATRAAASGAAPSKAAAPPLPHPAPRAPLPDGPAPALPSPPAPGPKRAPEKAALLDGAADFDDVFEPAPSWQRPPAPASGPIVLLDEDEAPTLPGLPHASVAPAPVTMAFDAPPLSTQGHAALEEHKGSDTLAGAPVFVPPPEAPTPVAPLAGEADQDPGTTTAAFAAVRAAQPAAPEPEAAAVPHPVSDPPPEAASASTESPDLSSTTLAELYFEQGFLEKAVEVYEQLLERDPYNERARARLIDLKSLARRPQEPPASPVAGPGALQATAVPDARAERRLVIERTIARLEGMLAAVQRP